MVNPVLAGWSHVQRAGAVQQYPCPLKVWIEVIWQLDSNSLYFHGTFHGLHMGCHGNLPWNYDDFCGNLWSASHCHSPPASIRSWGLCLQPLDLERDLPGMARHGLWGRQALVIEPFLILSNIFLILFTIIHGSAGHWPWKTLCHYWHPHHSLWMGLLDANWMF